MQVQESASGARTISNTGNGHVEEVVRQAHEELRHLLQQRAEVMRRIGTIKQNYWNWWIVKAAAASPVSPRPAVWF